MSIVDILKKWHEKKTERSEKFKEMEENFRLQKILENRQKSSNERELERYFEDKRQENIKNQLDKIRKQKTKESWRGNSILKNNGTNILRDNKKLFSGKGEVLHQENIFLDNETKIPITNKEMFFKW